MEDFKEYILRLVNLNDNEIDAFTSLFKEKELAKKEFLAVEGEYSTHLAFLLNGVMRAFYRSSEGKEYNKTFFSNSSFVGAYSSLTTKQQNRINIQCLTNCTILVANFHEITSLYPNFPKIERLARILAEYKFAIKEKREIELVTLEASQRYQIFKMEHPNLESLIPQYHIASYLGVTPTQLSRIRSKG